MNEVREAEAMKELKLFVGFGGICTAYCSNKRAKTYLTRNEFVPAQILPAEI